MDYRHEMKIEINTGDMLALRSRLSAIMRRDSHCIDGRYRIRSLYFDTPGDEALFEKLDGVDRREKFRLRYYNGDLSFITLEKKSKLNGLCRKQSVRISPQQAQKIVDGELLWMKESGEPLLRELYTKMRSKLLKPKTVVDYTREPFVYSAGNVRVTLDYDIRTGLTCTDFLNPDILTTPAADAPAVLEVKWDSFLPELISDAVRLMGRQIGSNSKYALCRCYG